MLEEMTFAYVKLAATMDYVNFLKNSKRLLLSSCNFQWSWTVCR